MRSEEIQYHDRLVERPSDVIEQTFLRVRVSERIGAAVVPAGIGRHGTWRLIGIRSSGPIQDRILSSSFDACTLLDWLAMRFSAQRMKIS